jgi:hypothetical protein
MVMIVIKPNNDNDTFHRWLLVDDIIKREMWEDLTLAQAWSKGGYSTLADIVPEMFGMTRMYRDEKDAVTFEFTEQQWTVFALRWLS